MLENGGFITDLCWLWASLSLTGSAAVDSAHQGATFSPHAVCLSANVCCLSQVSQADVLPWNLSELESKEIDALSPAGTRIMYKNSPKDTAKFSGVRWGTRRRGAPTGAAPERIASLPVSIQDATSLRTPPVLGWRHLPNTSISIGTKSGQKMALLFKSHCQMKWASRKVVRWLEKANG